MPDCLDLKMKNFPFKNLNAKATTLKASIRKRAPKEEITIERQVWVYLASTRWAPAPACHQGATWLELYVRFTQVGGQTRTAWEQDQAKGRNQSKREALARFTKIAKRVMDTAAEAHIRHLFRPSKEKARRLIPLGIVTHLGAITALPQWSRHVAEKVAQEIIGMTHIRTAQQAKQLKDKTLLISQKPVRLVGKALELQHGEENLLQRFVKRRRDQLREARIQTAEEIPKDEGQANSVTFTISCPHCQNERCPTGKFNMVEGASWKQIPCSKCERNTSASKWRCSCDMEWHRCQTHRPLVFELLPPKRKAKEQTKLFSEEEDEDSVFPFFSKIKKIM